MRLVVPGRSLLPVPSREVLARHAGQPGRGVDADEGFWVGTDGGNQPWVQLIGRGESPFQVRTGQRATFTGRLIPNPPGFTQRVGMVPQEGAALAGRQGHHIEVAYADITWSRDRRVAGAARWRATRRRRPWARRRARTPPPGRRPW